MDAGFISILLLILSISLLSFFIIRKEKVFLLRKQYTRLSYIFLIGYLVVHFQPHIDYLLGNLSENEGFIWVDKSIVVKSLLLSGMGLISYLLGYSLYKKKHEFRTVKYADTLLSTKQLIPIAVILLAAFVSTIDANYLNGSSYGSETEESIRGYFSFLFENVIATILILNARNMIIEQKTNISFFKYIKDQKVPMGLFGIYLLLVMMSGERNSLIFCGILVFFGYIFTTKKKIPLIRMGGLIVGAALLFTLLGIIRQQDSGSGDFSDKVTSAVSSEEVKSTYYAESFSPPTKELASSLRTVHIAVSNVPKRYPHTYGLFFMQDAFLIVPSLKGMMINIFSIPKQYTSSAQFLTFVDLGADATWGVGSSCVADTYLDFGVVGVVAIFFLFGWYSRKLEVIAFSEHVQSITALVFVFVVTSYSLYISRATILYSLSRFIYVIAFAYVPILLKKKSRVS